jgi:hypothetical protein
MTYLNNEVREFPIDELSIGKLDSVSGGWSLHNVIVAWRFEQYVQYVRAHPVIGTTLN